MSIATRPLILNQYSAKNWSIDEYQHVAMMLNCNASEISIQYYARCYARNSLVVGILAVEPVVSAMA